MLSSASTMTQDLSKTLNPEGKDITEIIIEEHRLVDALAERYFTETDPKEKQGIAHNIIKVKAHSHTRVSVTCYDSMTLTSFVTCMTPVHCQPRPVAVHSLCMRGGVHLSLHAPPPAQRREARAARH